MFLSLFPLQSSSAEVDATVTSTDIHIATPRTDSRPAYQLHVVFPTTVDDERVQAKFNKKKSCITLTMPVLSHSSAPVAAAARTESSATAATQAATAEATTYQSPALSEPTVPSATVDADTRTESLEADRAESAGTTLHGCGKTAVVDWPSRLELSNRLIEQSCLSYN